MRYPDYLEKPIDLPHFIHVQRRIPDDGIEDVATAVKNELERILPQSGIGAGQRVAVAVGSRGIDRLPEMVRALCSGLQQAGAQPFIVPAMGSHGGATAEGQAAVLERLGVTEATCRAPVVSSMAVTELGTVMDGIPLYLGRDFATADHTVCINRIKPHSKFKAAVESGLLKMLCVGMGKHDGALAFHRWALRYGWYALLEVMGLALAARSNFRFGMAVVENENDRIVHIEAVPESRLAEREAALLALAKTRFARLPFRQLDVLVVGRIGKEISGAGMDPNVTGRAFDLGESDFSTQMQATRVAILDLTAKTAGNAIGLGNADIITERVFERLDYEATLMNALTSLSLHKAFIPVRLPNDEKAIQACFTTLGPVSVHQVRAVIVRDTRNIFEFWASAALAPELAAMADVSIDRPQPLVFTPGGRLSDPALDA